MTERNQSPRPGGGPGAWAAPVDRRGFLRLTGAAGALGAVGGPLLAACSTTPGGQTAIKKAGIKIKEYVPGPQPVSGGHYGGTSGCPGRIRLIRSIPHSART